MKKNRLPIRSSRKSRRRARKLLSIRQINPCTWIVSGGAHEHTLTFYDNKVFCDCPAFVQGITVACSHVIRFYLERQAGKQ